MNKRGFFRIVLIILVVQGLWLWMQRSSIYDGNTDELVLCQKSWFLMDTYMRIVVYCNALEEKAAYEAMEDAAAWASDMEKRLNFRAEDSLIHRLNNARTVKLCFEDKSDVSLHSEQSESTTEIVEADDEYRNIVEFLRKLTEISVSTDKRFSMFMGEIVMYWNSIEHAPDSDLILQMTKRAEETDLIFKDESQNDDGIQNDSEFKVDIENQINNNVYSDITLELQGEGLIDLGGAAKGWIIDMVAEKLVKAGFPHCLVDAGGDIRVGGPKKVDVPWKIAIKNPDGGILEPWEVFSGAVATSGDYERGRVIDGVRYHHIIDPKTGYPPEYARSSTIHASTALEADLWATALMIERKKQDEQKVIRMHVIQASSVEDITSAQD